MFTPAFVGGANRVDARSVAEMRRVLIPSEDDATRMTAAKAAIKSVIADARKEGGDKLSPESIARALFRRFAKESASASKA